MNGGVANGRTSIARLRENAEMTKAVSMCWLAILFALGSGVTASAVPGSYATKILSTPDGFKAPRLSAINASGLIAGTAQDGLGRTHAFVWEGGDSIRELATPAVYIACGIHDMNDLGQCVGYATDASDNSHAIVWDADGTPRDLGALDGLYSIARGINNSGQIAGSSGAPDGTVHAMLWNASGGFTDLGQTYGWGWSRAHDINDSGQVVGASGGGSWTAFLLSGNSRIVTCAAKNVHVVHHAATRSL